jgi:ATP-dependent RNA helicase RhlE
MGKPQILVLEPTRELAHQVAEQFEKYGKHTGLNVALLYGGVGLGTQSEQLAAGADIVVATPGRLVDHFYRTSMRFGEVKDPHPRRSGPHARHGFPPAGPENRQSLPVGRSPDAVLLRHHAAGDPDLRPVVSHRSESIEIARTSIPTSVTHAFYPVAMDQRDELLLELLKQTDYHSVMIFTRTRKEADQLTDR